MDATINNVPEKTSGKPLNNMAPNRQRACDMNNDGFQEHYKDLGTEKENKQNQKRAVAEGGLAATPPAKKQRTVCCSNPSCCRPRALEDVDEGTQTGSGFEGIVWYSCGKARCQKKPLKEAKKKASKKASSKK
jgi:hypothetical protein